MKNDERLIILDLDQTILNTLSRFYETYNFVLELFGGKRIDWETFFRLFCRDELDSLRPRDTGRIEFWREFRRLYGEWIHEKDGLIEGAYETLRWLKEVGFNIVVTTGREIDKEKVWRELRVFGIADFVDDVYTLVEQDPEHEDILFSRVGLLKQIIKKYGVPANRVIFVGDYWVDMESGRKAGLITIGVLTGCKSRELLLSHGANYVIKDISELPELINSILRR